MSIRSGLGVPRHAALVFPIIWILLGCGGAPPEGVRASAIVPHSSPGLCGEDPPAGAQVAPPLPRYPGTCPTLTAGENTIRSSGNDRRFILAVPRNLMPEESLPVIFFWHWLGGSAASFYRRGEVQAAVDQQRFLAIIPEARGDLIFKWPYTILDFPWRMEEEFRFFDDMLACAGAQYRVNKECISSVGVSAGALFTAQLAGFRAQRLASAISLSGGVGGFIKPWNPPSHKLPMVVLWGGPLDILFPINFETISRDLEQGLRAGGHFMMECIHNCGHAEPPIEAPPGRSKYAALWTFVFDHPYWLADGHSPYLMGGIPDVYPAWCGLGPGSATPRRGACP